MKISAQHLYDNRKQHRALGLMIVALLVLFLPTTFIFAANNNYERSITMSSAKPSETPVTYIVEFTADSSYSMHNLIVDFCSNSPIEGQDCTAPGGFSVGGSPTGVAPTINGTPASGTWTPSAANGGRTFIYAGSAGAAVAAGDIVTFSITSVTNPNGIGSFYGRIFSYSIASPSYSDTSTDIFEESGEVALATANGAGFVFQVPESLEFCVYKTVCGDVPALILGHGANNVLDSSQIDTDTAKFSIATNALSGVVVFARGSPPSIGTTTLAGINGGNGVAATMVPGTEAFGFRVSPTSGDIYGAGCYADNGGDDYCFDNSMVPPATGAASLTGQTTPGPINNNELTMTFAATASNTTAAGIYQTAISLIASPTF
jgi:hypothetical protein